MASSIFISAAQLQAVAELGEHVVVQETTTEIGRPLEFWIMDGNTRGTQHRSVVVEQDGTVISDHVVEDD